MMPGLLLYYMTCNHIKRQDPNLPQPILSHYTNIGVPRYVQYFDTGFGRKKQV